MDRQRIELKLTLDALNHNLDLSEFDHRLVLQKTVYLLQAAGIDLGYNFGWYIRGPYSPGLTRDAFALQAELTERGDEFSGWNLSQPTLDRLARLRTAFESLPAESRPRRLELLASVHFLLRTRQGRASDVPGLREVLAQNRKDFSEPDIESALRELREHGFFTPGSVR
jgi:hypothetical protein